MITQRRLKELLAYEPATGFFRWRVTKSNRAVAGSIAGGPRDGYWGIRIDGRMHSAHHLVWLYSHGHFPAGELDHKDVNPMNNRLGNLRPATRAQNAVNRPAPANNTSGHKGVYWCIDAWRVYANWQGKRYWGGKHTDLVAACRAQEALANKLQGEFAYKEKAA
jgi:hypothetical protein